MPRTCEGCMKKSYFLKYYSSKSGSGVRTEKSLKSFEKSSKMVAIWKNFIFDPFCFFEKNLKIFWKTTQALNDESMGHSWFFIRGQELPNKSQNEPYLRIKK